MNGTIITLNCLLLPHDATLRSNLTEESITTLKISTDETVDQLRIMIRKKWPCLFEKVPSAEFMLTKVEDTREDISIVNRIKDYSRGIGHNRIVIPPHESISTHFSTPSNSKIHIIVFI
jgi:hypothetical protein